MARVLLGAGTWGRRRNFPWWRLGSPFVQALEQAGHVVATSSRDTAGNPLLDAVQAGRAHRSRSWGWTTGLDGVLGDNDLWLMSGQALAFWLELHPVDAIIAHSHAGNVVAYACHFGAKVPVLITVGTPVRRDLSNAYYAMRKYVGFWAHLWTTGDSMQILGTFPKIHFNRRMSFAARNIEVCLDGFFNRHSRLLDADVWNRENLWKLLDGGRA